MKKEKQQLAVEWLVDRYNANAGYLTNSDIKFAKEMENEQRQKKENQFVLNMPFDIFPMEDEEQTCIHGYTIKDAKGVEYYFLYGKDDNLVYDGWCAEVKSTKTEE